MDDRTVSRDLRPGQAAAAALALMLGAALAPSSAQAARAHHPRAARTTATPIEHLVVVIGENATFDALFATYVPAQGSIRNLLSEGIITADGRPGPQFALAAQNRALPQPAYTLNPPRAGPFNALPRPRLIGVTDRKFQLVGTGPDTRFPADLPPGPFQITRYVPYPVTDPVPTLASATEALSAATGNPVHRFFQMWQQTGGDNSRPDLYAWVAVTAGMGADTDGATAADPGQGGELMGFVNMQHGDAGYLRSLAERYAISDNYHQPIMGGTGANFFAIATGDLPVYRVHGALATPPANQIENPDPAPGSENFYRQDGYQGGSWVNCSDPAQPGVAAILAVLHRKGVASNCEPGAYYLVNNYGAGYDRDGHPQPLGAKDFYYPPQTVPTIAAALGAQGVSWKWYTAGRDAADLQHEMRTLHLSADAAVRLQYNDIGDPLTGSTAVMTDPTLRSRLTDLQAFDDDLADGTLPAVSFVVPKNLDSGHPGYSVLASYEAFVRTIVTHVQTYPKLWAHTAILVTTDEGGGYFDSGYIQVLDFFGDGPRIPLIVVSPWARRGYVDHTYGDHASILKFIEHNWHLPPLSARSRDNLPDPTGDDPYRPANGPAVGSLLSLFDFTAHRPGHRRTRHRGY
ncbi:MAG TPA: alkaline phosphatase family protein [Steroidobacteraceae bacterium]|nr:alkaline phosphatase family protein [Steroidobacteraceae bacterium]